MSKPTAGQKSADAAKKAQEQKKQAAAKVAAASAAAEAAKDKPVDAFKQALKALKIPAAQVFGHREYEDRIVIVTRAGQKKTWVKE